MSDDATLFAAGSAVLAVHGGITVFYEESSGGEASHVREEIWRDVRSENVDAVLEMLMATGAERFDMFVVACEEGDDLRVFVRGAVRVTVRSRSGEQVVQGAGIKTWSEQIISGWVGFDVAVDGSDSVPSGQRDRVASGMVSASSSSRTRSAADADRVDASRKGADSSERSPDGDSDSTSRPDVDSHADGEEPLPYSDMFGATRARTVLDAAVTDPEAVSEDRTKSAAPASAGSTDTSTGPSTVAAAGGVVHVDGSEATWSSSSFDRDRVVEQAHDNDGETGAHTDVPGPMVGDHDGHTISVEEARRLRGLTPDPAADASSETPPVADSNGSAMVQALTCDAGHPNPPYESACRICAAPLTGTPTMIPRPPLGRLRFSTGDEVILNRPLLIGRKPNAGGRRFDEIPEHLKLDVGDGLSRSHALIHLEGWQVRVEDLGSTNNTTVRLPGRQPQRLREGQPVLITDGAVIEFGGEVECIYDVFA